MKEKRKIMLERFVKQTTFESQEDFIKNFKVIVPENFNFGYDVVDVWEMKSQIGKLCVGQTIKETM
jgi:acetyl-CoA synthetase